MTPTSASATPELATFLPASPPRRPGVRWGWIIVGLLFTMVAMVALGIASLFRFSGEARVLRDEIQTHLGRRGWNKRVEVNVGRPAMTLAHIGSSVLPPEVRDAVGGLRGAKVGVYRLARRGDASQRAALLADVTAAMEGRGWERVVGVLDGKELVGVYAPNAMREADNAQFAFFVWSDRDVVVGSAEADLAPLLELAHRHMPRR